MVFPSSLFDRITTCSRAIRFLKDHKPEHASFYKKVMKKLPPGTGTSHKDAMFPGSVMKASLAYLKLGFRGSYTPLRKINIALYVAITIADDHEDESGLAREICTRFRNLDNFDKDQMMKIFNFSLCSDRVTALLDKVMVEKIKNVGAAIDHELRVEFIVLYFSILESLVRRGQSLVDLGYPAHATCSDMEAANLVVNKHASSIATKCWTCFDLDALKKPRPRNKLFPAGGAFPRVSIVREHVDFDAATTDNLQNSLLDRGGKPEFVAIMRAIISLVADGPAPSYANIELEPVKTFFVENILTQAQSAEAKIAISELAEIESMKQENAELKEKVSDREMLGEKYRSVVMMLTSVRDERDELKIEIKKLKDENWLLKAEIDAKREYHNNWM